MKHYLSAALPDIDEEAVLPVSEAERIEELGSRKQTSLMLRPSEVNFLMKSTI